MFPPAWYAVPKGLPVRPINYYHPIHHAGLPVHVITEELYQKGVLTHLPRNWEPSGQLVVLNIRSGDGKREIAEVVDLNHIKACGVKAEVFRCPWPKCAESRDMRWKIHKHFEVEHCDCYDELPPMDYERNSYNEFVEFAHRKARQVLGEGYRKVEVGEWDDTATEGEGYEGDGEDDTCCEDCERDENDEEYGDGEHNQDGDGGENDDHGDATVSKTCPACQRAKLLEEQTSRSEILSATRREKLCRGIILRKYNVPLELLDEYRQACRCMAALGMFGTAEEHGTENEATRSVEIIGSSPDISMTAYDERGKAGDDEAWTTMQPLAAEWGKRRKGPDDLKTADKTTVRWPKFGDMPDISELFQSVTIEDGEMP